MFSSWRTSSFLLALIISSFVNGFSISRSKIPEEAVQYQLDALRESKIPEAFEYNSPSNQAVTGPWQAFASSLAEHPFRPILGHSESSVLMTIRHDNDSDYVCCLVKVVPGKDPLPTDLAKVIEETKRAEGLSGDDDDDDDEDGDDSAAKKALPSCVLYWWEVSKQYDEDGNDDNFYYSVDSVLPDAVDLEMDFMETTLFAVGDEFGDDEDDDDPTFFLDMGM